MLQKIQTGLISFSRHMAGHSKWANIKHIKGAKDAERATLHQKLFRQIKSVIRGILLFIIQLIIFKTFVLYRTGLS